MVSSLVHSQVEVLCDEYPLAPKVVLVPRSQHGRALEDGLARQSGTWAGLSCLIPRHFAQRVARPAIRHASDTEVPAEGRTFLVASLLSSMSADALPDVLPETAHLAPMIAAAIDTLRQDGVDPVTVRERAERSGASASLRAVSSCYERYCDHLNANDLYDDADLFRWAETRLRESDTGVCSDTVVGISDGIELSELEATFIEAVLETCRAFYRIGRAEPDGAPPQTVGPRFESVGVPTFSDETEPPAADWTFRRVVGRNTEVETVLRDILDADVSFDEVEIAYTESTPYLARLADVADEVGVPMTVGPGRPSRRTAPGQALHGFLGWVAQGFDAERLIHMLRAGHVRLGAGQAAEEAPPVDAHEAASLLAARRYEPGRDGYRKAFDVALEETEDRIAKADDQDGSADQVKRKRDRLIAVRSVVKELLNLVPDPMSIRGIARAAQTFLERFGPTDRPPEDLAESERTLDQAARDVLWQKLEALRTVPFRYEASASTLARLFQRWLEGRYVRAQHPRSGAVHVVPLESAGYGDRSHLYVVGMDGDSFSTAEVERGLLGEDERQRLRSANRTSASRQINPADEILWRADRALARHRGTCTLYARTYDVESGKERYPAPLFLRLESEYGSDTASPQPVGLVPPSSTVSLRDADVWLSAVRADDTDVGRSARKGLRNTYPWIVAGEEALRARRTGPYGEHDGLLPDRAYPELDLFEEESVSASRLETLAETPYVYFLRYVLDVEPLDEPALEDDPWLSPLRRGSILHDTFERFMRALDGGTPTRADWDLLYNVLRDCIDEEVRKMPPRSRVEEEIARRQLRQDAQVFLRAEMDHTNEYRPLQFEVGFGGRRQKVQDVGAVRLEIGDRALSLRGRIDRVDRAPDGGLAIWDYKTGQASAYDEEDPLQDGAHLQWVLYALALQELTGDPVRESGYFFPTVEEMGTRVAFRPARYREETEGLLERLSELARSGSFPMTPNAKNTSAWRYRGYDRLFHDLRARCRVLRDKAYPEDRPAPPFLD